MAEPTNNVANVTGAASGAGRISASGRPTLDA